MNRPALAGPRRKSELMESGRLTDLLPAVIAAGAATMRHRAVGVTVDHKSDESPVTAADHEAEAILLAALATVAPGIPVIAEEEAAAGRVPEVDHAFFLVDPLDGTKEYVNGGNDFTVNVGLIEHGEPVFGIVYAPALATLYWGDTRTGEAWKIAVAPKKGATPGPATAIRCAECGPHPRAVASKSHSTPPTEAYLAAADAGERVSVGSSLKFLLLASGEADLYPRPSPTMEWDTAAGDAILRAAGGMTYDLEGAPFTYGKPHFFNPGFVAVGRYAPAPLAPFCSDIQREPGRRQ